MEYKSYIDHKQESSELSLNKQYPGIFYQEFIYTDNPDHYLLIDDLSDERQAFGQKLTQLKDLCGGQVEIVDMQSLAAGLTNQLAPVLSQYNPDKVLLLTPGGGGRNLMRAVPSEFSSNYSSLYLPVSRNKSAGNMPMMPDEAMLQYQEVLARSIDKGLQMVVVCDDAVNKGTTLTYLKELSGAPAVSWIAATPILLYPDQGDPQRYGSSSIPGYEAVFASQVRSGIRNPVSFNFLSSLTKPERTVDGDPRVLANLRRKTPDYESEAGVMEILKYIQSASLTRQQI